MLSGVYKIRNETNDRFYIGSSNDIVSRWNQHKNMLASGIHPNKALQIDYDKSGIQSFKFEILETIEDVTVLRKAEQKWLDALYDDGRKCYNLSSISVGLRVGKPKNQHSSNAKTLSRTEATLLADWMKSKGNATPQGWVSLWRMHPSEISKKYKVAISEIMKAIRRDEPNSPNP